MSAQRISGGDDPAEIRRVALSSFLGNTIEFYDFVLYGMASAIIFNRLFFSNLDPVIATISSFATMAAGYVARPLGGVIFGHLGDRLGRKRTLLITMTAMGLASGVVGLLPTYKDLGVVAPLLLVTMRLIQGLAVGGEWGGAGLMTAEHAQRGRRGLITSMAQMGQPAGWLLAALAVTWVTSLPAPDMFSWGWRVPFVASFALLALGLFVRLRVSESPVFLKHARMAAAVPKAPVAALFSTHLGALWRGVLAGLASLSLQGIFGIFMISYAIGLGFQRPVVMLSQAVAAPVAMVAMLFWGRLSDRIGRRPVFLGGAVAMALLAYPSFALIETKSVPMLFLSVIVMSGLVLTAMNGLMVAILTEMFPTEVRYSGVSVSYQIASTVGAGFGPLIGASLVAATGATSGPVAMFLVATAVISGAVVWASAETRESDLQGPPSRPDTATAAGRRAAL